MPDNDFLSPLRGVPCALCSGPCLSLAAKPYPPMTGAPEVAEIFGINRKTAYAALRNGEIPGARRIGRSLRVCRDSVFHFLAHGPANGPRPRGSR